jgi:hypothetical protein
MFEMRFRQEMSADFLRRDFYALCLCCGLRLGEKGVLAKYLLLCSEISGAVNLVID